MKALIAMSGGVDSSAAALLMLQRGYECAGVTMKLFDAEENSGCRQKRCCSLSDVNDARMVAARLEMPYYVLNLKEEFARNVICKFVRVYRQGGTPNPCIDCNRYLKFQSLVVKMRQFEFDRLVTGHYARIEHAGGRYLLKKGADRKKDQSYVLYMMTQEQLAVTEFPLGGYTKDEARRIAAEYGLATAAKQESQDICFVPDGDYGAFIEAWTGTAFEQGNILDTEGKVIGRHRGFACYTLGQRRGLGVSSGQPLYVSAKSPQENTITLGPKPALYAKSLDACQINLIACDKITAPIQAGVKIRYLQQEARATIEQTGDDNFHVEFDEPQSAITCGQAVVLYDGDTVIGGGTIGTEPLGEPLP